MKSSIKKTLGVLLIAVMFVGSTFAFIINVFAPLGGEAAQQQDQPQRPESFVVEGKLEGEVGNRYVSQGYTLAEFHYNAQTPENIRLQIDNLPADLDFQIVVQKISDLPAGQPPYLILESLRESERVDLEKGVLDALPALCAVLVVPPADCAFIVNQENSTA